MAKLAVNEWERDCLENRRKPDNREARQRRIMSVKVERIAAEQSFRL